MIMGIKQLLIYIPLSLLKVVKLSQRKRTNFGKTEYTEEEEKEDITQARVRSGVESEGLPRGKWRTEECWNAQTSFPLRFKEMF